MLFLPVRSKDGHEKVLSLEVSAFFVRREFNYFRTQTSGPYRAPEHGLQLAQLNFGLVGLLFFCAKVPLMVAGTAAGRGWAATPTTRKGGLFFSRLLEV